MDKIKLDAVIIVEGKYDKIKLSSLLDATIITTDGFSVFKNDEKKALIKRLCKGRKTVIMTDTDKAGFVIRNRLRSLLAGEDVIHLYVPEILGKEKRKKAASKQGLLGVEGISADVLRRMFEEKNIFSAKKESTHTPINKATLYKYELSGKECSAKKRSEFCKALGLPSSLGSNALVEAVNLLQIDFEEEMKKLGDKI